MRLAEQAASTTWGNWHFEQNSLTGRKASLSPNLVAVPEPSTLVMFLLMALAMLQRRQAARASCERSLTVAVQFLYVHLTTTVRE